MALRTAIYMRVSTQDQSVESQRHELRRFIEARDGLVLVGTYQHRCRRDADRWRFAFLRIVVRYRARLASTEVDGRSLKAILAKPV